MKDEVVCLRGDLVGDGVADVEVVDTNDEQLVGVPLSDDVADVGQDEACVVMPTRWRVRRDCCRRVFSRWYSASVSAVRSRSWVQRARALAGVLHMAT